MIDLQFYFLKYPDDTLFKEIVATGMRDRFQIFQFYSLEDLAPSRSMVRLMRLSSAPDQQKILEEVLLQ